MRDVLTAVKSLSAAALVTLALAAAAQSSWAEEPASPSAQPSSGAASASPSTTPADPIVAALRPRLTDTTFTAKSDKDDVAALAAFYADRSGPPLWVDKDGFTARAKSAMDEIRKADDWGLVATAFDLPTLGQGQASPEALAEAEGKLGLAVLKYARYARGGRFNPTSLSRILDQVPPVKDPRDVLSAIALREAPDGYLRSLHPKHEQFERLRQALLKARGPVQKEAPVDEALKVKLPQGKSLKPGADDADIALLRKRLKVPAEPDAKDTLFDPKLADALKAFQKDKGIAPSGNLNGATRQALNREGEAKKASPQGDTERLLINMERWRWMPENLGSLYVWDNIPEFMTRVVKGGNEIFKEKIIVGMPEWATPVFSADMQFVIFSPSWGVPDGIKVRELLPRLRNASGGFLFFGGGGGGDVLRAYGLTAYNNGREIDPDNVNWGSVDIRNYTFVQPPGGKNPLGFVKFRFPNKHDVYMHDTVQRELFAQSNRALSHGCMRVQNPRRLAELLLFEDRGWSPEKVGGAIASGGEIALGKPIPVHVTYFTAVVDEHGKVSTYGDIYGHDSRLAAALTGKAIRFEQALETASADDAEALPGAPPGRKGKKAKSYSAPDSLADAITGLLAN